MLWRKKKQLLQLSLEKRTVKGIKLCKGVQVPVKEPQSIGLVPSWKAVVSPNATVSQASGLSFTEAKKRFVVGFEMECMGRFTCTGCLVCVHKHVPVLSLCPAERSSIKALDTSLPAEAGCDKSALVQ